MFHIVYEMKKKQMADAQQKQEGTTENASAQKDQNANTVAANGDCATADLLDLATELDNIQRVRMIVCYFCYIYCYFRRLIKSRMCK